MRKNKVTLNLFWVLGLVLLLTGFQNLNAQKKDNDLVLAANKSFYTAFRSEDISKMDQVWSHSDFVSAIHPMDKAATIGWDGVRIGFVEVFKVYNKINITPVNPIVHVEGNVAWVLETEDFEAMVGDKTVTLTAGATNIFLKQSGKWMMIHHQATVPMKQ
jgi:ketosteroid isomerase-like protein